MSSSVCKCDGSVDVSLRQTLFGDDLLNSQGIYESSFTAGATDPRPIACEEAVGQLRATGQDPCNLDSPDDLQVLYKLSIPDAWNTIKGTPVSNPIQKAVDQNAGTATPQTADTGCDQAEPGSLKAKLCGNEPVLSTTGWIGFAIIAAAALFIVVFAATR